MRLVSSNAGNDTSKIARAIQYKHGEKTAQVRKAETAFDRRPMVYSALRGTLGAHKYCFLEHFSIEKRDAGELDLTQYNGGETRVEFTYFCYTHTEREIDLARERGWTWQTSCSR